MAEVKPAEVSAILKKQLSGFEASASLNEVGTVLTVGDGIARVHGLSNVQYGELVEFDGGLEGIVLNLEERSEEHTSELQSRPHLVCRLLLEKKKLTGINALLY